MSHWDFSRRADGEHDAPPRPGPAGTGYEPDPALAAAGAWPPDGAWDDDDWDDDEGTDLYPITYERDDFAAAATRPDAQPAPPPAVPWEPWPPVPYPEDPGAPQAAGLAPGGDAGAGPRAGTAAGGRPPDGWQAGFAGLGRGGAAAPDPGWPAAPGTAPGGWDGAAGWDGGGHGARPAGRGRRRLVLAGVVVAGAAAGAAAVLLLAGRPAAGRGGQAASAPAAPAAPASAAPAAPAAATAPLTLAQAKGVLAGYTTANNSANAQRSDALLATVETGSSYAIDAGLYQTQAGTAPYPAFGPAQATYYIPQGEQGTGPRWFVVQVANAFSSAPGKVTSSEYLLFTQPAPGDPWQNAVEPYLLPGASAPQVAVGADGLATAVGPDAASVAVAPGQLPAATAAALDAAAAGAGQPAVSVPGDLADVSDQRSWQAKLPGGTVTDAHAPATGTAGQEFALQTAGGGALVFYTDAAQVTITPPAGTALHLTIPGFYSPGQSLSQAGVAYLEQFAAYDPPAGGKAPAVVADYSGITGKS